MWGSFEEISSRVCGGLLTQKKLEDMFYQNTSKHKLVLSNYKSHQMSWKHRWIGGGLTLTYDCSPIISSFVRKRKFDNQIKQYIYIWLRYDGNLHTLTLCTWIIGRAQIGPHDPTNIYKYFWTFNDVDEIVKIVSSQKHIWSFQIKATNACSSSFSCSSQKFLWLFQLIYKLQHLGKRDQKKKKKRIFMNWSWHCIVFEEAKICP